MSEGMDFSDGHPDTEFPFSFLSNTISVDPKYIFVMI